MRIYDFLREGVKVGKSHAGGDLELRALEANEGFHVLECVVP
jgi:hypothetical protein